MAALLIAIVLHELAHGLVAYIFGDDTAKRSGRLTLNPLKHLDIFGIISLLVFKFGWANPVPVNSSKLKNYNVGMFFVSIAGITINFLLAFITARVAKDISFSSEVVRDFVFYFIIYNLNLAFFNLIPLPPLDGSNIILSFFPETTAYEVHKYNRYTQLILLALIISGAVSKFLGMVIQPVFLWMVS
ncbi:site-2 protease family protein [Ezakiella coagulans]|nr:site-2 protease family protein [Ezakiella coagulans]